MDVTAEFRSHQGHLRAVAYRILGSASDVDDALQEAWLRLERSNDIGLRDPRAWLTTVVARICLDSLRKRAARHEVELDFPVPDDVSGPEQEATLADSVGQAMLVVLDTLTPPERLAFVLHDLFAMPFAEIASILDRSVPATKMLASRARSRLRMDKTFDSDQARRREAVEAFLAASREGDFAALLRLLDPDVTARAGTTLVQGRETVARQALAYASRANFAEIGQVDGEPAIVVKRNERLELILLIVVTANGTIADIDIVADPGQLARLSPGTGQ